MLGGVVMENSIRVLRGKEIKDFAIQEKLSAIHTSWSMKRERHLFSDYGPNIYLVLGSDWYLIYSIIENPHISLENLATINSNKDKFSPNLEKMLYIDFFEAMKTSENLFRRSVEMYVTFKMLARQYKDFLIEADVNDYSFPFCELFLQRGLIHKLYEKSSDVSKYKNMQFCFNPNKLSRTKP